MGIKPENWSTLTPEQKREIRLNWLLKDAEEIQYVNSEAKARYLAKVKRKINAYTVQEPDRVPVTLDFGLTPLYMHGVDYYTSINEPEKAREAFEKFNVRYSKELDEMASPTFPTFPAKALDILDYKLFVWPGHGVAQSGMGYQFMENEYMLADEYDEFIKDPSYFFLRRYIPRIFGAMSPLKNLSPLTDLLNFAGISLAPLGNPDMSILLQKMLSASQEFNKFTTIAKEHEALAKSRGFPSSFWAKNALAPFDALGDTLRGTSNIIKDMYRRPDKLLKALEVMADIMIHETLASPFMDNKPAIIFPLHKGADGWMSQKQFETFYWPQLKRVIKAFNQEGYIVELFAEGSFNTRVNYINEFPKGFVAWHFDQSDMAQAKKILGSNCCIIGNVPASLLVTGTADSVKEYCRKLIETCAPGGGYILSYGAISERPKVENLIAIVEATKEFGTYK